MTSISVCIIAKNEEKTLDCCLRALKKYPFEIVFTDTGSTDQTKDIASKYTDKIYDFAWINDFSAARNFCAEKASNDWILCIDCDEYLDPIDLPKLENYMSQHEDAIGTILQRSINGDTFNGEPLILDAEVARFYNRKKYHFIHTIHEQIVALDGHASPHLSSGISVLHSGYAFDDLESSLPKRQRNIDLLEKELSTCTNPNYLSYLHYQLGISYKGYITEKALYHFEKALVLTKRPNKGYFAHLIIHYGNLLTESMEPEQLLNKILPYKDVLSDLSDYNYLIAVLYEKCDKHLTAIEFLNAALHSHSSIDERTSQTLPNYYLGCIYRLCGKWEEALDAFKKASPYENSEAQIEEIKNKIDQSRNITICILGNSNSIALSGCILNSLQITNNILYLNPDADEESLSLVTDYSLKMLAPETTSIEDIILQAQKLTATDYLLLVNEYELPTLVNKASEAVLVQETFQTLLGAFSIYHSEARFYGMTTDSASHVPYSIIIHSNRQITKEELLERFDDKESPLLTADGELLVTYADYHYLLAILYMQNGLFNDSIQEFLTATTNSSFYTEGTNSYMAFYHIGLIYELSGLHSEAITYYEKCGDFAAARNRLAQLK